MDTRCHRTGRIQYTHIIRQCLCQFRSLAGTAHLRDFISDRPAENTRMTTVTFHHHFQIPFPPSVKIQVIIHIAFSQTKTVKRLIHHINSQSVAGIQKCLRRRVVRTTHRIIPGTFKLLQFPFLRSRKCCRPKQCIIMVNAAAEQFDFTPVYSHSAFGVYLNTTKSDKFRQGICSQICIQCNLCLIQCGSLVRPKLCPMNR